MTKEKWGMKPKAGKTPRKSGSGGAGVRLMLLEGANLQQAVNELYRSNAQ